LPNKAALAAVISHALAHAALGHDLDSSFAFNDRLVVPSLKQLPLFDFKHTPEQEAEADALGMKILGNSPYKENLGTRTLLKSPGEVCPQGSQPGSGESGREPGQ